jgi:DNA-binding CsgD family transcriptional regulator
LELARALGIYWNYANRLGDAAALGDSALDAGRRADPAAWARAAGALSYPHYWAGDTEFLSTVTAEAVNMAGEAGDLLTVARRRAIPLLEFTSVDQLRETLAMVQAAGDRWFEARTLGPLAITELHTGDPQAQAHLARLGELAEEIGSSTYRICHRLIVALQLASGGEFRAALEHLDGVFPTLDRMVSPQVCLRVLADMAWYALLLGDRPRLEQAVRRLVDAPLERSIVALRLHPAEARPFFLVMLAHCAADAGSHTEAARLLGAADALRDRFGLQWFPRFLAAGRAEAEHETRVAMGDEHFAAAYAEGSSLDVEQVVAYALRAHGRRNRPPTGWASLTPTELQVAHHIAAGQSNPQIASALLMSRATVKTHLSHICPKLGVTSRAELAAEAARHLLGSRGG